MMYEVLELLRGGGDTFAAAELVERDAASAGHTAIGKRYFELINDLYWKAKDVSAAMSLGRLGVHYCLMHGTPELRDLAKQMAYNLGSSAWPGWAEPGVTITDADLVAGHDA